jgi:S-adenosylmethionine hydrolase
VSGCAPGARIEVRLRDDAGHESSRVARWVTTYADARPSELVVLVDSYGLLALALDRTSAAVELGLHAGSGVTLLPEGAGGAVADPPRATPVDLTRRGDQ